MQVELRVAGYRMRKNALSVREGLWPKLTWAAENGLSTEVGE